MLRLRSPWNRGWVLRGGAPAWGMAFWGLDCLGRLLPPPKYPCAAVLGDERVRTCGGVRAAGHRRPPEMGPKRRGSGQGSSTASGSPQLHLTRFQPVSPPKCQIHHEGERYLCKCVYTYGEKGSEAVAVRVFTVTNATGNEFPFLAPWEKKKINTNNPVDSFPARGALVLLQLRACCSRTSVNGAIVSARRMFAQHAEIPGCIAGPGGAGAWCPVPGARCLVSRGPVPACSASLHAAGPVLCHGSRAALDLF